MKLVHSAHHVCDSITVGISEGNASSWRNVKSLIRCSCSICHVHTPEVLTVAALIYSALILKGEESAYIYARIHEFWKTLSPRKPEAS